MSLIKNLTLQKVLAGRKNQQAEYQQSISTISTIKMRPQKEETKK